MAWSVCTSAKTLKIGGKRVEIANKSMTLFLIGSPRLTTVLSRAISLIGEKKEPASGF
jgi:hypothetical protein